MSENNDSKNETSNGGDSSKPLTLSEYISRMANYERAVKGKSNEDIMQEDGDDTYDELSILENSDLEQRKKAAEVNELIRRNKIRDRVVNLVERVIRFMASILITGIVIFVLCGVAYFIILGMKPSNDNLITFFMNFSNSVGFFIALVVAPITSITAITVALLYGAFKKSGDKEKNTDKDEGANEAITKSATVAASTMQGDSSGLTHP